MEKFYNFLNDNELNYLDSLIFNQEKWEYQTKFGEPKQYYDSLKINQTQLENYYNIVTENGKYVIKETGLNVIRINTQIENKHFDESDLSYVTYLNDDFIGGNFIYYENKDKFKIKPEINLTLKINQGILHEVEKISQGMRFSLYTFLLKKQKINNTLL
jgi:hypothetical protein